MQSPYINLTCGMVLLFTAGYETWDRFSEYTVSSHHGILVFSIIQILKTLPEIVLGLQEITAPASKNIES